MTRYEEAFKRIIVELTQTGRSVRGLAKEYGISEATIYKRKIYMYQRHCFFAMLFSRNP